jgi:hypothetical protein
VAYQRHQGVALCHLLGVRGSLLPTPLGDEAVKPSASASAIIHSNAIFDKPLSGSG